MQPNATRPVMDVARRPSAPVSTRMAVRPAPKISPEPRLAETTSAPEAEPEAGQQTSQPQAKAASNPVNIQKSSAPVGIIVMALLVMMVLIGLAFTIYLTSQG